MRAEFKEAKRQPHSFQNPQLARSSLCSSTVKVAPGVRGVALCWQAGVKPPVLGSEAMYLLQGRLDTFPDGELRGKEPPQLFETARNSCNPFILIWTIVVSS